MRHSYYNLRGDQTQMGYREGVIDLTRSLREQVREEEESYFRKHEHALVKKPESREIKKEAAANSHKLRHTDEPFSLDRYGGETSWRDMSKHERHIAEREVDRQLRENQEKIRGFLDDRPTNSMMRIHQDTFKTQVPGLTKEPGTTFVTPRELIKNQGRHDGEDDPYGIKRPDPRVLEPNGKLFTGKQGMYANNRAFRSNIVKVGDAADATRGKLNQKQMDRMSSQFLKSIQKDMYHNGLAKKRINLNMLLDQAKVAYNWYRDHLKGGMTVEDAKKARAGMKKAAAEMKATASQLQDLNEEVAQLVTDPANARPKGSKTNERLRGEMRKAKRAKLTAEQKRTKGLITEAIETPLGTKLGTEVGLKQFDLKKAVKPDYIDGVIERGVSEKMGGMSEKMKGKQKMPPTEEPVTSNEGLRPGYTAPVEKHLAKKSNINPIDFEPGQIPKPTDAIQRAKAEKPIPPSDTERQAVRDQVLNERRKTRLSFRPPVGEIPEPPPRGFRQSKIGSSLQDLIPEEVGNVDDRMDEGFRDFAHPNTRSSLAAKIGKFLNSLILARRELKSSDASHLYREDAIQDLAARVGEEGGNELTEFTPRRDVSTTAGQATDQVVNHHDAMSKRGGPVINTHDAFKAQVELWRKDPKAAEQKLRSLHNSAKGAHAEFDENWIAPSKNGIMASIKRMTIPSVRGVAGGVAGFVTAMEFPELMKAMGLNDQDMSRPVYDIASGALSAGAAEAVTYKLATGAVNMAKVAEGGLAGGVGMVVGDYATQAIETAWKLPADPKLGDFQARDVTADIAGGAIGAVGGGAATLAAAGVAGALGIGAESAAAGVAAAAGPVGWMVAAGIGLSAVFGAIFGTQQALTDEQNYQKQVEAAKAQANTQNKEYDFADHSMVITSQYQSIADELAQYGASASLLSKIHTDWMSHASKENPQPMTEAEYDTTFRSYLSQLGGTTNVNATDHGLTGAQIMEQQISNSYKERGSQLTALANQLKQYGATNIDPSTVNDGQPLTESQFVTKYNGLLSKAGDAITSKHNLDTISVQGGSSAGPKYNISSITPPTSLNAGDVQFYQDMIKGIMKKNNDQTSYNQAIINTKKQIVAIASQYYREISHDDFKSIYTKITEDSRAMFALSYLTDVQRDKVIRNVMTNEDSIDGYTLTDTNGASTAASNLNTAFTDTAAAQFTTDFSAKRTFGFFDAPADAKTGVGDVSPNVYDYGEYEGDLGGGFGYVEATGHGGFLGIGQQYDSAQNITLQNTTYQAKNYWDY